MDTSEIVTKVNRIRTALSIIEDNPAIFIDGFSVEWNGIHVVFYDDYKDGEIISGTAKAKLADAIRVLRRALGGDVVKDYNDYYFSATITMQSDPRIQFVLKSLREAVCRKVDTGETHEVEEYDYEAPKVKVTKPIFVWECDSILSES